VSDATSDDVRRCATTCDDDARTERDDEARTWPLVADCLRLPPTDKRTTDGRMDVSRPCRHAGWGCAPNDQLIATRGYKAAMVTRRQPSAAGSDSSNSSTGRAGAAHAAIHFVATRTLIVILCDAVRRLLCDYDFFRCVLISRARASDDDLACVNACVSGHARVNDGARKYKRYLSFSLSLFLSFTQLDFFSFSFSLKASIRAAGDTCEKRAREGTRQVQKEKEREREKREREKERENDTEKEKKRKERVSS